MDVKEDVHGAPEESGFNAPASKQAPLKVGSINPVGDFEKMIAAARDADEDGVVSRFWLVLEREHHMEQICIPRGQCQRFVHALEHWLVLVGSWKRA